ncbi:MAG: DivIVA domain-containing protein [Clostridia bacterium]
MITVKDIREKEFTTQKHGYHEDEVDDFLDEIADQMEELIRENRGMIQKLDAAQVQLEELKAQKGERPCEPVEIQPIQLPASTGSDDSAYFRNLEATLRETLLSAQRIADQTTSEAKKKAAQTLSEANQYADSVKVNIEKETVQLRTKLTRETSDAQAQLDSLKKQLSDHKSRFRALLETQMEALKLDEEA